MQKSPEIAEVNINTIQNFLEVLPFPVFIKNINLQYIYCNSLFSKTIYNLEPYEVIGKTIGDIGVSLGSLQIDILNKPDVHLFLNGKDQTNSKQILCADGRVHYFHEKKTLLNDHETGQKAILGLLLDITEDNDVFKDLLFAKDYLNALMRNSIDHIYFKDLHSRFTRISDSFAKRQGGVPADFIGKSDFDLYGPEHSGEAYEDEQEIIRTGIPIIDKEEKEDWTDGRTTWVSSSKMPFYDFTGRIIGTFGISREITKLKQSEIENENMRSFEKLISKISAIFLKHGSSRFLSALSIVLMELSNFFNSKKGCIFYLDERISKFVKIDEYPVKDHTHNVNFDINKYPNWAKILEQSLTVFDLKQDVLNYGESEEKKFFEANNISQIIIVPLINYTSLVGFIIFEIKDQSRIWLKKYKSLFRILSEVLSNSLSNYEAEKFRYEAEEETLKLLRAVNQSTNIVIIMDVTGKIEYVNSTFTNITGYSIEEVMGSKPNFLMEGLNSNEILKGIWHNIESGEPWEGRFLDTHKDGKPLWESISLTPIRNSKGEIANLIAILDDITEKIADESRKSVSQRLESIGQLAAGIAHEINTPMQYIGDNTTFLKSSIESLQQYITKMNSMLENELEDNNPSLVEELNNLKQIFDIEYLLEEIPQSIEQTEIGIKRVTNIVKAMKDFVHPNTKEKVLCNINHGIEVTVTISKNEWKYVADLELQLDDKMPLIYCLQDELNQVILGMIINATQSIEEKFCKKNGKKGKITISTSPDGKDVVIKISDNGNGIKSTNINRIFDPFFTTKEVGKGTGQGLTIAHDLIVNKHGGSISVDSNYGDGTTFTIKIPIGKKNE